ncbi:hypothetical protein [Mycolicibacter hiberniae]|uniref:Alanine and proline rich membrane protein n=1 Tax=Mycolicibacter hiberniae TaxID=29314 RepID=A0A7I7X723_9MYCO|nr:hypothetical protein [Mycolicibacter hiberniae]BBZ25272.1 hypothetical protein MHIB_36900 [Mycolicibacter hiberniae]
MPETSPSETSSAKPKSAGFPQSSTSASALSVPTIAALALAVIGIVLAILGWFHPSTGQKFSDDQRAEAKGNICNAQAVVRQGTQFNTNLQNPVPGDLAGDLAVGTNARLSLFAGGAYLHQSLNANPGTPADIAKAVGDMADTLEALSINYLAGHAPDDEVQQPLRDQLRGQIDVLDDLCQEQ